MRNKKTDGEKIVQLGRNPQANKILI